MIRSVAAVVCALAVATSARAEEPKSQPQDPAAIAKVMAAYAQPGVEHERLEPLRGK